jgi:hypothetical protein
MLIYHKTRMTESAQNSPHANMNRFNKLRIKPNLKHFRLG